MFIKVWLRMIILEKVGTETTAQAFCVFLPLKTVGVKGDDRSYDWVMFFLPIRIASFNCFMTLNAAETSI